MAEEAHIAIVATWLVGKHIWLTCIGAGAEVVSFRAVNSDTYEISACLVRIVLHFLCLWRVGAKNDRNIDTCVFQLDVGRSRRAEIAARACVRHPGGRSIFTRCTEHVKLRVARSRSGGIEDGIGPVGKGDT